MFAEIGGGLGLLLLGLWFATDALSSAAGTGIRRIVGTRIHGRRPACLAGLALAVASPANGRSTRTAIGLVNSGLIGMFESLWLLAGASLGGAVAVWLAVASGWGLVATPAYVLLLIGAIVRSTGADGARVQWGNVMLGWGACLLGISHVSAGFTKLGSSVALDGLNMGLAGLVCIGILLGAGLAILLRSHAAVLALAVCAAAAGSIELYSAMALVIGANLGAGFEGALLFKRGTPRVRRAGGAQLALHGMTTLLGLVIFLCSLPLLVRLPEWLSDPLALALFHTAFSAIGLAILLPAEGILGDYLGRRFLEEEQAAGHPHHLDGSGHAVPELALEGLKREMLRISEAALDIAARSLAGDRVTAFRLKEGTQRVSELGTAVAQATTELLCTGPPMRVTRFLTEIPRAAEAYRELCERSERVAELMRDDENLDSSLSAKINRVQREALHLIKGSDPNAPELSFEQGSELLGRIEHSVRELEGLLFERCASMPTASVHALFERLDSVGRIGQLAFEAGQAMACIPADEPVASQTEGEPEGEAVPAAPVDVESVEFVTV